MPGPALNNDGCALSSANRRMASRACVCSRGPQCRGPQCRGRKFYAYSPGPRRQRPENNQVSIPESTLDHIFWAFRFKPDQAFSKSSGRQIYRGDSFLMPLHTPTEWLSLCKEENKLQPSLRRHIHRVGNYVVKIDLAADEPDAYGDRNDPRLTRLLSENAKAATEFVVATTAIPIPTFVEDGYIESRRDEEVF
jgi:hypothetical protein